MSLSEESLELHKKHLGKLAIKLKVPLNDRHDLSLAYTPGVAQPCIEISKDKSKVYDYTFKSKMVAVISDGTAVLGLGDIGPEAGLPVMEGKCALFKKFAGLDAFPICIDSKDPEEIIKIVKSISPVFGGINLEDISAPRCFYIEEKLKEALDIPLMHDDQHGTAVVVLAGLINALKVSGKGKDAKIVFSGAGAAGTAITKLLLQYGFTNIILCDKAGAIYEGRKENMNPAKEELARLTNKERLSGKISEILVGADIFIGVSGPNQVTAEMVSKMNSPIIFAMANPVPEIMPDEAKKGGAVIVASGRSDFPNQINNVLAFPGIFKGAMKIRAKITKKMLIAAAEALASMVKEPTAEKIIPGPFDKGVANTVARAVIRAAKK